MNTTNKLKEERRIIAAIGKVYEESGHHAKALEHYEQTLKLARESEDERGKGIAFKNIAEVYEELKDYKEALAYYEQVA